MTNPQKMVILGVHVLLDSTVILGILVLLDLTVILGVIVFQDFMVIFQDIISFNFQHFFRRPHQTARSLVMQWVSNSRVRDRLGFRHSGSDLESGCVLVSGSARTGFFVGFLYLVSSQISIRVWFGFMLKSRVWVSVCKKQSMSGFCRVWPRLVTSLTITGILPNSVIHPVQQLNL